MKPVPPTSTQNKYDGYDTKSSRRARLLHALRFHHTPLQVILSFAKNQSAFLHSDQQEIANIREVGPVPDHVRHGDVGGVLAAHVDSGQSYRAHPPGHAEGEDEARTDTSGRVAERQHGLWEPVRCHEVMRRCKGC